MHVYSFEKLEVWKESIRLEFISEENYKNIRLEIESISNKINALRKHFINA